MAVLPNNSLVHLSGSSVLEIVDYVAMEIKKGEEMKSSRCCDRKM